MDGYYFTIKCSLQSPVTPSPQFRFYITQNFTGVHEQFSNTTLDVVTDIISETSQSVTVNGSFVFSVAGVIHVSCYVYNPNGQNSLTSSVRLCGWWQDNSIVTIQV